MYIYILDDDPGVIHTLTAMAELLGHEVKSFTAPDVFLGNILELELGCIFLDYSMPGMNGLEVASALRHQGSSAAVVFLTIHDDQDFVAAAQEAGGTGYVVKRRLASDLMVAVQEARAGRSFVSALS